GRCGARQRAARTPAPVLRGAARRARPRRGRTRTHVGRRAVAVEAAGGTRTDAARPQADAPQEEAAVTTTLTHRLDRTIVIGAPPSAVFKYSTDSARWAAWWGAGSTIDARPGGRVFIRHPGGNEASGEVLEVTPPSRIVFTYGYATGQPFGPGESRITITLSPAGKGTRLQLSHAF